MEVATATFALEVVKGHFPSSLDPPILDRAIFLSNSRRLQRCKFAWHGRYFKGFLALNWRFADAVPIFIKSRWSTSGAGVVSNPVLPILFLFVTKSVWRELVTHN